MATNSCQISHQPMMTVDQMATTPVPLMKTRGNKQVAPKKMVRNVANHQKAKNNG